MRFNFISENQIEAESNEINMTPLIDIVFLLLIFFMLTTTFQKESNIKLDLPKVSSPEVSSKGTSKNNLNTVLNINKNGEFYIDNSLIKKIDLKTKLTSQFKDSKEKLLTIRADKESAHKHLVSVMDLAKEIGISNLAIVGEEQ